MQDEKDLIFTRHYENVTDQSLDDFDRKGGFENKVRVDKAIYEIWEGLKAELGRRLHFY